MFNIRRITLFGAIALFAAISGWSGYNLLQTPAAVQTSGEALIGGPFELTRHDGTRVNEKSFAGRYSLFFFGYTFCPDVCPAGLQVMSAAMEKLGTEADAIQPVFVTIDPARDTTDVLAAYVENFHPRLIGLTGSRDEIAVAAKAYRVYYAKAASEGSDEDYLMDHSSIFYLMDPDGRFVKHFGYTTDVNALAESLRKAIKG